MKNGDFVKRVAKSSGVVEAETATILRALFGLLARTLEKGIMVRLPGVGAFDVRQTAKRTVRNPSTGEKKRFRLDESCILLSPSRSRMKSMSDIEIWRLW